MQATLNVINREVIVEGVRLIIQNTIFIENNLIAIIWNYLRPSLVLSIEALFILLYYSSKKLKRSPLSIDKYYKSLSSYSNKQLSYFINIRSLIVSATKKRIIKILNI